MLTGRYQRSGDALQKQCPSKCRRRIVPLCCPAGAGASGDELADAVAGILASG